jgi:hypothetical protein
MALVDVRQVSGRALAVAGAVVLAVVAVAAGVVLRPDPDGGGDGRTGDPGGERAADEDGGTGGGADEHVLNDTGHGRGGGPDDPAVIWYEQLSTLPFEDVTRLIVGGVGSDLPAADQQAARDVAARFVTADLTGVGRDQFPRWQEAGEAAAPARACCRDVTILAAGAARYPAEPTLTLALVVWSAAPVEGGVPFDEWEASFVFLGPAGAGGFVPVDPSTVRSWEAPPGLGQPSASAR